MFKKFLIILFLIIAAEVSAVELWNGFTTDMRIDDVKNRINEIYTAEQFWEKRGWFVSNAPDSASYRGDVLDAIGYDYPEFYFDCVLTVKILNPEYNQRASRNLVFAFYHEKLFMINIIWPSDEGLMGRAIERYGRYSHVLESDSLISSHLLYLWTLEDKDFILEQHMFWYIDRETYRTEKMEIERQQRIHEEEEKRRRQEANSGVIF
jgi:hypothetical protein